ncbi:unnamed protein product [Polarella glacialis]|uniref:EndoU domain-containing protein n=1 Tax=Polarella glacialis TaxID=89957 RepID=A0A813FIC8_POLGL|nr:unnamed protein product [Polarella glacialis]
MACLSAIAVGLPQQSPLRYGDVRRLHGGWRRQDKDSFSQPVASKPRSARRALRLGAAESFALGLAVGVTGFWLLVRLRRLRRLRRHSPQEVPRQQDVGGALVQAATRGPAGLERQARVAYNLVGDATGAGVKAFQATGDFGAVSRAAALQRTELVERVIDELRSGRVDPRLVAESLVEAALSRAARAAVADADVGGEGIYAQLWSLDEGRASVSAQVQVASARNGQAVSADVVVDEQRTTSTSAGRGESSGLRPLFARVRPHVLARPTALALLEAFDVFRARGRPERVSDGPYSAQEEGVLQHFLEVTDRTPVMRRCRAHAEELEGSGPWSDADWGVRLWRIWFQQPAAGGRGCGFEHVFVGEATVDAAGRDVVGGLHNWFKFYLEEQRGAARYLGLRYPGRLVPEEAARNPRFVSGRFTWDLDGRHLVKDVGGFFVGVSPEWQLAVATVAFFETETADRAFAHQWSRDIAARDVGFTRVARLGHHVYRLSVYRGGGQGLTTFFASQLGHWGPQERAELDAQLSTSELERRLPALLVLHGFADEPELLACAARVAAAGSLTLREALRRLREELAYNFEAEASTASLGTGSPEVKALLVEDGGFREVAAALLEEAAAEGRTPSLTNLAVDGGSWTQLLRSLQERTGRSGRRLFRPLRFALTGRLAGHDLQELLRLLQLLEAGAPWGPQLIPLDARLAAVQRWLTRQMTDGP